MKINLKTKMLRRLRLTLHPRYKPIAIVPRRSFIKPKSSFYRLIEKQRLRYHHALSHKQLAFYASKARRYAGPSGLSLLCQLAMRLDSILFQVGFADSIRSARQLIRHGHVFVNGYCISVPSYKCRANDLICMAPVDKVRRLVNRYLLKNRRDSHFNSLIDHGSYATVCVRNQKILLHREIKPRELKFRINHMLVMEYFS